MDIQTFQFTFGKLPLVMAMWVCMQVSTLLAVYPVLFYWAKVRNHSGVAGTERRIEPKGYYQLLNLYHGRIQ